MSRVRLCAKQDVAPGSVKRIDIAARDPLMLAHTGEGFFVIEDTCSHALASLSEGILDENIIFCPLHAGGFDVTSGAAVCAPCVDPVKSFPVIVEGEDLWIELP
jgi:nitrite reductase/ring-hydroxylating ferredoxin subunit